jgi:hypothetical protein
MLVMANERDGRDSKESIQWAKDVIERDNYLCQHCGAGENLCAHHIIPWEESVELRYVLSNGLCLCRACHAKHHGQIVSNLKGKPWPKGKKRGTCWNKGLTGLKIGTKKGTKFSDEHRANISKAKMGSVPGNKGIPMSDEEKARQSAMKKGKKWRLDPETGKRQWYDPT